MDSNLIQQAIDAAINNDWKLAIKLNSQITKNNPKDIEALNRLARAYFQLGHKSKAIQSYQQVLKLDKYNPIATKGLDQTKKSRTPTRATVGSPTPLPVFLEEPGITRTVSLSRLGDPKIISNLHPGDWINLTAREHCVSVLDSQKQYLGRLPDDLALRMRSFIKAGNIYSTWIKSIELNSGHPAIKIFIREVKRAPKYKNSPSFPLTEKLSYAAFTPPELVHEEKPEILSTEEESGGSDGPSPLDQDIQPMS
jgi:hypothetical protein